MRKPSFPREIVRQKINKLFANVSAFEPIRNGQESQAFRFASENSQFIFRVNAEAEVFEKDRFVYESFARPQLPIPKVFLTGRLEDHFYCVSQLMPGRTLEDLDPGHISQLLAPTCEVWRAIAESDVAGISGYGPFDSQGRTTFPTWRDFLVGVLDTAKLQSENARPYMNPKVLGEWLDTFHLAVASCPEERALVHGDFGSNNVLAEREHITGVIDWSEAMIGDPLYDVANVFFWRTWLPCMERQAQHFEAHLLKVPDGELRILCYQLRIGLSEIFGNSADNASETAVWALGRCEQIVGAIKART